MEIDISKLAKTVMSDIEEIARAEMARVEDVIDTMAKHARRSRPTARPEGNIDPDGRSGRKTNMGPDTGWYTTAKNQS